MALFGLIGCGSQDRTPESAAVTRQQDLAGFPYHPLVLHLDLSILSYQLYAQTLVWPFDPYYEDLGDRDETRADFMKKVALWAAAKGQDQTRAHPALGGYRGPGRLAGFADNPRHDPIVYRYDSLRPWNDTISSAGDRWVEYLTPEAITGSIRDVHMCYRKTGGSKSDVVVDRVASNPEARGSKARDVLLAFEGGTGDKGEIGQPASQSLMGLVLLRYLPNSNDYDVHISFRGSRSGSLGRSVLQAFSDTQARGNPDWITDLGYDLIGPEDGAAAITTTGKVHRGFAQSMKSILPQLFGCLGKIADLTPGKQPRNIFATGHSLGGGLAQHFVSAVLLGDQYGPDGNGAAMPKALRSWPWRQIKLITFSAPRAGNATWAKTLTTQALSSNFFSKDERRFDFDALSVDDPSVLPRLTDRHMPTGYRVLISTDPITTSLLFNRKSVGQTIYADQLGPLAIFAPHEADAHEPEVVRDLMIQTLDDPRIPTIAWRYRARVDAPAEGQRAKEPILADHRTLEAELEKYYTDNSISFKHAAYRHHVEVFNGFIAVE